MIAESSQRMKPPQDAPKFVWIEDNDWFHEGVVQFTDGNRPFTLGWVALADSYPFMNKKRVTIHCIKPDEFTSRSDLKAFKCTIEDYMRDKTSRPEWNDKSGRLDVQWFPMIPKKITKEDTTSENDKEKAVKATVRHVMKKLREASRRRRRSTPLSKKFEKTGSAFEPSKSRSHRIVRYLRRLGSAPKSERYLMKYVEYIEYGDNREGEWQFEVYVGKDGVCRVFGDEKEAEAKKIMDAGCLAKPSDGENYLKELILVFNRDP